jgi:primosomal protein N'
MVEKNDKKRTQSLIQVTKKSITQGKQVLILVPEVSCITRLKDSFPTTLPLFSYAASQTTAQKSAVWQAVASGQPAVVIGTQKALFLPWQTLGVVILEQAHYSTHKLWDQYPRLDNRYGASVLSRIHHADYVISASTLSLEMYFALEKSSVDFTSLNPLYPITQWLSPTFADKKANRLMPMIAARKIQSAARKKQNIFILHNNRQSSLAKELRLKSSSFVTIGTSAALTQLEGQKFEAVFWLFPEAAVFYPDIRSTERSWLLLCRLAQLSRGGKVTVITKHPRLREYFFAREGSTFFQQQLAERQRFHYPPFTDIVRLTFIDKKQSTAVTARKTLQERLKPPTKIRGPYQSLTNPTHTHLLLTGNLPTLAAAYQDLKADIVDVAPDKII